MKTDKTIWLALLGIVAIVLIVGLVLMTTEKTGQGIYIAYETPIDACRAAMMCNDGGGAILVSAPWENPARCVCPEHFIPGTIFDWTSLRRGEVTPPELSWYTEAEHQVRWQ